MTSTSNSEGFSPPSAKKPGDLLTFTVADMLEALRQFPPETRVLVYGYEGGFNDVLTIRLREVFQQYKDRNTAGCMGVYASNDRRYEGAYDPFSAVVIG